MTKKKSDTMKRFYILLSTLVILSMGGNWLYNHFAKTKDVQAISKSVAWVEERLAIGTHDARVHQAKRDAEAARDYLRFKENDKLPTAREKEEVRIKESRLKEAEKERQELIEQYRSEK